MSLSVYIESTSRFLPGPPIDNDQIESILGLVRDKPSRLKKKILQANGIKTRHYAINAKHETTIQNHEMASQALNLCLDKVASTKNDVGLLSCATSQGDLVLPGFASIVQATSGLSGIEINTSHGICSSSMMALKYAYLSLLNQEHKKAVVVGSELSSRLFKASRYEAVEQGNAVDFNSEFLRWMLSDGAGAFLLSNQKRPGNLRINWIRSFSHADAFPVCMSIGSPANDPKTWQDYPSYGEAEKAGAILIRQDVRLLEHIVKVGVDGALMLINEGVLDLKSLDHFLCHYSSHHFKSKIFSMLDVAGCSIPEEKWYTNLYERGNTGCASIFIMLDEFLEVRKPKSGDQILCMVPESGRFNTAYMHLTVV